MEYTRITPNGEERCEMLTTEDKLTRIKAHHMGAASCETCGLELGKTCPTKLWADWTDEEINTAYDTLTAKYKLLSRDEKTKAVKKHCASWGFCSYGKEIACPLDSVKHDFPCYDSEDDIDLYYSILVSEGYVKPPVNFVKVNPDDEVETENDAVESDAVNHPNHYTQNGIECIEAIRASMTADGFCDYCKGNVLKYLWRWRDKGGIEDLRKARVYLDWLIEEADK